MEQWISSVHSKMAWRTQIWRLSRFRKRALHMKNDLCLRGSRRNTNAVIAFGGGCQLFGNAIVWDNYTEILWRQTLLRHFRMTITTFQMVWTRSVRWLVTISHLIAKKISWLFRCARIHLSCKCVSIVVYAHFFVLDKKLILIKCVIFRICEHFGISMFPNYYGNQRLFGTTWGRVNDDRIFIFGWIIPLSDTVQ